MRDKPVCDSCGGMEFDITEIKEPEVRRVPASFYFRPPIYNISIYDTISFDYLTPELTKKAVCQKCSREYLY
ncbi:hypothetical protein LCGC14_2484080 [marine sediment metagenome]|uniref:Uncharacterized protein n=1 Tax=marine sediment metagenome TaxID=412755 RepID=A0A0F9B7F8_9ZZZZ